MTVDVRTEIEIDRPRQEVSAYASDPDNAPAWYLNIDSVEWKTPKPVAVGSRIEFSAKFLGRRMTYTYEVKAADPGTRFVMATSEGPFPMETTYEWSDTEDGATKMSLRNRGVPDGLMGLLSALAAAGVRRANRKDLKLLKQILEGR
jgi:uncharacterized membrane protein